MAKYKVIITGIEIYVEVEADNEEEAIEEAIYNYEAWKGDLALDGAQVLEINICKAETDTV